MAGGRQSEYTEEVGTAVCAFIANGMSLREVERQEGMPVKSTIMAWSSRHGDFAEQYAQARVACLEYHAEEMLDIADDSTNDWIERKNSNGDVIKVEENGEAINRSRLRLDTRKWLLSKLVPKKYGDRQTVEHDTTESFNDFLAKLKNG